MPYGSSKTPELVTLDVKDHVLDPADEAVLSAASTGLGIVQVTPEELGLLAKAAAETSDYFLETALEIVTEERAKFVRKLRCEDGYSWRAVAHACYDLWEGDWSPPSNQLMGMALCEISAKFFNENSMVDPWN